MILIYKIVLRIIITLLLIFQMDIVFLCKGKPKYINISKKDNRKAYFHLLDKKISFKKIRDVSILYNSIICEGLRSYYFYDFSSYFVYLLYKAVLKISNQKKYNKLLLSTYIKSLEYVNLVYKLPGAGLEPA